MSVSNVSCKTQRKDNVLDKLLDHIIEVDNDLAGIQMPYGIGCKFVYFVGVVFMCHSITRRRRNSGAASFQGSHDVSSPETLNMAFILFIL